MHIMSICIHYAYTNTIAVLIGRETPRTPRAPARGHAARLNRRAGDAGRRVVQMAFRMGPAKKSILQVRHPPMGTPPRAD
jgi:hypothetical protein